MYMYIHMYTMAKTIMVSNGVYEELKGVKRNRSFSELFQDLLSRDNTKKGMGLKSCLGILKRDKEWESIDKDIKGGWRGWSKKYV